MIFRTAEKKNRKKSCVTRYPSVNGHVECSDTQQGKKKQSILQNKSFEKTPKLVSYTVEYERKYLDYNSKENYYD